MPLRGGERALRAADTGTAVMEKPHILLITTDEQHMRTLSCYGATVGCTPETDALARCSDVYENAYTVSPVCLPSRCAWMTGLYPHVSGSISNAFGASLSREWPNLFTELKKQGYRTALHGKCHFIPVPYPATRPDMTLEYEHFITYYRSLGMDTLSLQDDKNNSLWYYDDYAKELAEKDMLRTCRYEAHVNPENHGYYDFPFEAEMHPDAWTGNRAVSDIENCDGSRPNFIWVSFSGPHYPIDTPKRYTESIDVSLMGARVTCADEWDDESKYHFRGYHGPGTTEGSKKAKDGAQKNYSEEYWQSWRRRYFGNIALIDEKTGQILRAAQKKFGDNLMVIFTADHGEMMGNHSLWGKSGSLFEDVLRVPLLVHRPGQRAARRVFETVSSLEIFPTILSAGGAPLPKKCDGMPLDRMVQNGGRPFIISECDNRVAVVRDGVKLEVNRAGRKGRVYYELYDLKADPHEFVNLYEDARYTEVRRELYAVLEREPYLMETVFCGADGGDYWLDLGGGAGFAQNGMVKK